MSSGISYRALPFGVSAKIHLKQDCSHEELLNEIQTSLDSDGHDVCYIYVNSENGFSFSPSNQNKKIVKFSPPSILKCVEDEMESRYKILAQHSVRNLDNFKELHPDHSINDCADDISQNLMQGLKGPDLVLIVDNQNTKVYNLISEKIQSRIPVIGKSVNIFMCLCS